MQANGKLGNKVNSMFGLGFQCPPGTRMTGPYTCVSDADKPAGWSPYVPQDTGDLWVPVEGGGFMSVGPVGEASQLASDPTPPPWLDPTTGTIRVTAATPSPGFQAPIEPVTTPIRPTSTQVTASPGFQAPTGGTVTPIRPTSAGPPIASDNGRDIRITGSTDVASNGQGMNITDIASGFISTPVDIAGYQIPGWAILAGVAVVGGMFLFGGNKRR